MALIKCKECGHEVSDLANVCPNCGAPIKFLQDQKEIVKKLELGEIDVVIGTHRTLSKDVIFKDLGLLIIDEEHTSSYKQEREANGHSVACTSFDADM